MSIVIGLIGGFISVIILGLLGGVISIFIALLFPSFIFKKLFSDNFNGYLNLCWGYSVLFLLLGFSHYILYRFASANIYVLFLAGFVYLLIGVILNKKIINLCFSFAEGNITKIILMYVFMVFLMLIGYLSIFILTYSI